MFIHYNKFAILTYFITGTTITFSGYRWIYGGMILALSAFILLQSAVLTSGSDRLLRYQNITQIPAVMTFTGLIVASLYVLAKAQIPSKEKLLSLVFLLASLGYNIAKSRFRDNFVFTTFISEYIGTMLFMVVLLTVGFIDSNQAILSGKTTDIKDKLDDL